MKKLILIFLLCTFISLANASIPSVQSFANIPGGGLVAAMQAQENLKRQYIENKMLQEQLAMLQQQRAIMKMQAETMRQKQMRQSSRKKSFSK